jgi:hypothetical protein
LNVLPYGSEAFSTAPSSTFPVVFGLGNTGLQGDPGELCSPGAYSMYVTGTDGAQSNTHYIPVISPWNMWAGYNSTDEFQVDFAGGTTCKYKLSDGTQDGVCLPIAGLATIIDGNNLVTSGLLGNTGIGILNATTGADTWGNNSPSGDNITGVTAKNGIVGYTQSTNQKASFFTEVPGSSLSPIVYDNNSVGIAPAAIAMSTGCDSDPNTATAFIYDEQGTTLYRVDAVQDASAGTVTASAVGSVALAGFAQASQLTNTFVVEYVVTWDTACKAAVFAPVITGTNPDGGTDYDMQVALVDMTTGKMHQIGTYVSDAQIPASAIRFAADPAGNAVVIASTDDRMGTTSLVRISWTLDANENPTFTTTVLGSAPPTGVYGVSLGVLPNGKISVGQRQQHYVLADQ